MTRAEAAGAFLMVCVGAPLAGAVIMGIIAALGGIGCAENPLAHPFCCPALPSRVTWDPEDAGPG